MFSIVFHYSNDSRSSRQSGPIKKETKDNQKSEKSTWCQALVIFQS